MTVRGFLIWYLGAVLFIGTAGASGYHILSRHRALLAERDTAEPPPSLGALPTSAAMQPISPTVDLAPAPHLRGAGGSPSIVAAGPRRPTAASALLPLPPLRPHVAAADAASDHTAQRDRRVAQRPIARTLAARRSHHPAVQAAHPAVLAATTPPLVPHWFPDQNPPRLRPAGGYAELPPPSAAYYPGYRAYPPGYPYYYQRYPYYRVY